MNQMIRLGFMAASLILLSNTLLSAQTAQLNSNNDVAFWVDHWSRPPLAFFGPDEENFNQHMKVILFPWNDHDEPSNPAALDENVQWLKEHPNVRFYLHGYASSRGELMYNLNLSQRRADWVRQTLVSHGISENRIRIAVGWGELYPVCPELNDECWSKNRLVRFVYSPE
jgi:outer membrane protein OmpA-like peptidoglycan-associated protein